MIERSVRETIRHHTAVLLAGVACVGGMGYYAEYNAVDNMGGFDEVARMEPTQASEANHYIDGQTRTGAGIGLLVFLIGMGAVKSKPFGELPEEMKR